MQSISYLAKHTGSTFYYDEEFRNVLEDHLKWIKEHPDTETVLVSDGQAYRNSNDFYGLLTELGVPKHLHWVTMRVNGLYKSIDYQYSVIKIIIPKGTAIEQIRQTHISTY